MGDGVLISAGAPRAPKPNDSSEYVLEGWKHSESMAEMTMLEFPCAGGVLKKCLPNNVGGSTAPAPESGRHSERHAFF